MNTTSISTSKRRGFWAEMIRFVGRLIRAALNLIAAALMVVVLGLALLAFLVATKPVQVSDGVAPAWQTVRAHLMDMKRWDPGCWTIWGYAQVYATPIPLVNLIRMDYGQTPTDPAIRRANLRALYFMVAYGHAKSPLLAPEQGHRQYLCYITPPEYRTVAELKSYPWPWEEDATEVAP